MRITSTLLKYGLWLGAWVILFNKRVAVPRSLAPVVVAGGILGGWGASVLFLAATHPRFTIAPTPDTLTFSFQNAEVGRDFANLNEGVFD